MKTSMPIGTVAKMIGVSSQALRFYAERNVIEPNDINKNNGYRQYTGPDICHLFKARYLKSMGFSLNEVVNQNTPGKSASHGVLSSKSIPLGKWISLIEERRTTLDREIKHMQKVQQKVCEYLQQVSEICDLCGVYRIEDSQDMIFLEFSNENNEMSNTQKKVRDIKQWVKLFPISRYAFICKKDKLLCHDDGELIRGLTMSYSDSDELDIHQSNEVVHIPSRCCVHTIIRMDMEKPASSNELRNAVDYIQAQHYLVDGDAFGMWLSNAREVDSTVKYFEVWIPIKEDKSNDNAWPYSCI